MANYSFNLKFKIIDFDKFEFVYLNDNCEFCNKECLNFTESKTKRCCKLCALQMLAKLFHLIFKDVCIKIPNYKYLKQYAPIISSLDEKNHLQMDINITGSDLKDSLYYITFKQVSFTGDFFSLEELKTICKNIQKESKKYILIDEPILFIRTNDILG